MTTADDVKAFAAAFRDRCKAKALRGEWLDYNEYNECTFGMDLMSSWFEKAKPLFGAPKWRIKPQYLTNSQLQP